MTLECKSDIIKHGNNPIDNSNERDVMYKFKNGKVYMDTIEYLDDWCNFFSEDNYILELPSIEEKERIEEDSPHWHYIVDKDFYGVEIEILKSIHFVKKEIVHLVTLHPKLGILTWPFPTDVYAGYPDISKGDDGNGWEPGVKEMMEKLEITI